MVHTTSISMPKHEGLALHILKQIGSKSPCDQLRWGNNRGKKYKYSIRRGELFVPAGVLRGRFSQYALDNLDFHEHTPTGVTMHATTHNIYQYKDDEDESAATIQLKKD